MNLVANQHAWFLYKFPDNNVYFGIWGAPYNGVYRYLTAPTNLMDPNPYISTLFAMDGVTPQVPAINITGQVLSTGYSANGAQPNGLFTTSTSKVFSIAGLTTANYQLVQYYPTVTYPTTSISSISVVQPVLSYLLVAGTDSLGTNKLVLYDTTANTEQNLLAGYNIEIYHLNFVASGNKVMFDGLNFANNTVVLGQVSLTGGGISIVSLGSGSTAKLTDFKTF